MTDARLTIDLADEVGAVDDRVFGSFIEHMGRSIYGGIYEPDHPTADPDGWRTDVRDLVRRLGVSTIRYPGGNFVSGYDWEDGVGPRTTRPVRHDMAWRSIEPNLVGTDEFIAWARSAGAEPMLTVNLGTRGAEAARNLVEYCNGPRGTLFGDQRAANGHPEPYGVRTWCLGNEMDGPWQIGHTTADEYGRRAAAAGLAMREVDPAIELVACGSSGPGMPTFGAWERTVLERTRDVVDHISLHLYVDPADHRSIDSYLASSRELDRAITAVASIIDEVAGGGRRRAIGISVDEYNVWYLTTHRASEDPSAPFRRAPAIAEDTYDLADALVVGCLLITLLRRVDRVRIACLAQLVNVIPLIRTEDGGRAWLQTTAFPFADVASYGRGTVVGVGLDPTTSLGDDGTEGSAVEATAVHAPADGHVTLFAVNRLEQPLRLDIRVDGGFDPVVEDHFFLADADIRAANTADDPDRVAPRRSNAPPAPERPASVVMPARSWNVVRLAERQAQRIPA